MLLLWIFNVMVLDYGRLKTQKEKLWMGSGLQSSCIHFPEVSG